MYIIDVLDTLHLSHVYYGKKIEFENISDLVPKFEFEQGSATSYSKETKPFSLGNTLLEVSTFGKGDYREPSLHLEMEDGSRVSDFLFKSYKILNDKKQMDGLPSLNGPCTTLLISLVDEFIGVEIVLEYNSFYEENVITRNMKIINGSKQEIVIDKAMSMNIDFYDSDY